LKRVWKIRLDPDRIVDFGPRFVDPEFEVADALLHRLAGRSDVSKLAAPAPRPRSTGSWAAGAPASSAGRASSARRIAPR
jgi:hypothetical protein